MVSGVKAANIINNYFSTVGFKLANNIESSDVVLNVPKSKFGLNWNWNVTVPEVRKLLSQASSGKSSGISEINSRLLLDCLLYKVDVLTDIYNKCFNTGIYPDSWKCGIMVPIPKKQNVRLVENLRPITLLPLPGKILEKIIHKHMYFYLENCNLICPQQGGFRPGRDTIQTVLELTNYVHEGFNDNSSHAMAVFVDLAKAFDSIDRTILVKKLESFGFSGKLLNLLKNYLVNRKQRVNLNGIFSDEQHINYGVPQGSIIGPLMFILFINDLPSHHFMSDISIYADDTVFYYKSNSLSDLYAVVQSDMNLYYEWCKANKLILNILKTKSMLFCESTGYLLNLKKIKINDVEVDFVDNFTYLGISLDRQLKFTHHYNMVMSRLKQKIHLFCSIRSMIDINTAVIMYKSHLLSFWEYGSIFMECLPLQSQVKIQRLQNKCLRVRYKANRFTSNFELHQKARILPLKFRRKIAVSRTMFRRITRCPELLAIPTRLGNRSESSRYFKVSFPNKERYKRCLAYAGPKCWNSLPKYLRNCNQLSKFKTSICLVIFVKMALFNFLSRFVLYFCSSKDKFVLCPIIIGDYENSTKMMEMYIYL